MEGVKEVRIVLERFADKAEDHINGLLKNGWQLYGKLQARQTQGYKLQEYQLPCPKHQPTKLF